MARLSSLSSSQSVSFRHGTNVEFNSPGFQPNNGPPATGTIDGVPPMEGYNLQAISHKSRDFSNPMYDAVQSGTTVDPTSVGNGSGKHFCDNISSTFLTLLSAILSYRNLRSANQCDQKQSYNRSIHRTGVSHTGAQQHNTQIFVTNVAAAQQRAGPVRRHRQGHPAARRGG